MALTKVGLAVSIPDVLDSDAGEEEPALRHCPGRPCSRRVYEASVCGWYPCCGWLPWFFSGQKPWTPGILSTLLTMNELVEYMGERRNYVPRLLSHLRPT